MEKSTTKSSTQQDNRMRNNPEGKGGFGDNPHHRNPGGWKKDQSISYQYNFLIRLNVDEFGKWLKDHPEKERTMAQELAYQAVLKARKELKYLVEITDRVEGKAPQTMDVNTSGELTINMQWNEVIKQAYAKRSNSS